MIVSWHGHACVSLHINGYTIVIDPHDGASIGLRKPSVRADLVLVTHDHFDHNAVQVVSKDRTRVFRNYYGEAVVDNIKITGLRSFHDKARGKRRGENSIYVIETREYKIVHLGDLGDIPEDPLLEKLKDASLLIIPVGGTFTIEPSEAWSIVEKIKPLNVLPIHYWIAGLTLPLKPVEEFLKHVKDYTVTRLETNTFDLKQYKNTIFILKL